MRERRSGKVLLAFGIVYFVWGSTFLAIRVGVHAMPPLLMAALRFATAGAALWAWATARGEQQPRGRQWLSIVFLAAVMFLCDYGLLFWAETRIPSGIAAVMLATIPAFIAIAEVLLLRTRRFTASLVLALLIGLAGIVVLTAPSSGFGASPLSGIGAAALLLGAVSWALATVLTRKLPLPESKTVTAGAEMLVGGLLLAVAAAGFGEWPRFHPSAVPAIAWAALAYLIVAGSIVGFTAYLWLLHHQSPTRVGTYAYVNPLVAVALGYWLGGESLGLRTALGTLLVLGSVVAILTTRIKS